MSFLLIGSKGGSPVAGGILISWLYPLLYIGSLVASIVIATGVWRLVKAQESISITLMEVVEELRKKNRGA